MKLTPKLQAFIKVLEFVEIERFVPGVVKIFQCSIKSYPTFVPVKIVIMKDWQSSLLEK
ncbi:hypothetical protein [Candidatus Venteria ishoeyi]|uniref:hypothetical protein n=1 Tax=Candidatus Venteria ishoeyi TaxID=1899563 RepID=UPI0015B1E6C4|nr:hypothetical protein [Candidatus Venteria ishoeyi]